VLAEREWYGEEAQIIRLRFPLTDIWSVSVAVHELGHSAGPRLSRREQQDRFWERVYPLQTILRREYTTGQSAWSRMHELFADAFAVYLTGPAYACACALLRFDPVGATSDGPTHPSNARRLALMFRFLERMDDATGSTAYGGMLGELRARWRAAVAEATGSDLEEVTTADERLATETKVTVDELWDVLHGTVESARYSRISEAQRLKPQLVSGPRAQPTPGLDLADVLNAAWLNRVDHLDDPSVISTVGSRARDLCFALVKAASDSNP